MEYEIKPQGKFSIGLKELLSYNELFYFFTWRDIKVKYKQTLLGILWAIFQPILMTTLFVLSFGRLITISNTSNIPYPIFVLSGFLLWQSAHSEFYFCEAYWPNFRQIDFLRAVRSYAARHRRFGI